uniref:G-protein coupled receptors family 1 profile domain-containing protein n=1 Tax=Megaselia scalaris TaxID=36166 RepID=T1H430_MEGSC
MTNFVILSIYILNIICSTGCSNQVAQHKYKEIPEEIDSKTISYLENNYLSTEFIDNTSSTDKINYHNYSSYSTKSSKSDEFNLNSTDKTQPHCIPGSNALGNLIPIILYSVVCIIGLFGNTLVIYVVLRFSKMQTVTNMYILNLAIADECFLIGIPFLLTTMHLRVWKFGEYMCKAYTKITHCWTKEQIQRKEEITSKSHQIGTHCHKVYILCWLPYWISQVALINSPLTECASSLEITMFLLVGCLGYSNSAMNPILYAFLSDNFKKSFLKACTCNNGIGFIFTNFRRSRNNDHYFNNKTSKHNQQHSKLKKQPLQSSTDMLDGDEEGEQTAMTFQSKSVIRNHPESVVAIDEGPPG